MLPLAWGCSPAEHARAHPADTLLDGPVVRLTRAVTIAAAPETTWRWLCQLSVAPYSYDRLDNWGRRSPREVTPGAEDLRVGQTMMSIFRLADLDPPWSLDLVTNPRGERLFGPVAVGYRVDPDPRGSRLVARVVCSQAGAWSWARARLLAWGDLVMMRRQLLNLKELAEGS